MKKIGILGGSFNPPTVGHIKLAEHALKNTDLDEVWLTPCYSHRDKEDLQDPLKRFRMCHLATEGTENIFAFSYEIDNKMEGSTFDFLSKLMNDETCDVEISYIIGQDNADEFHKWHKYEELKSLCRFIVFGRTGIEEKKGEWYNSPPHTFLSWDFDLCSSTMVREQILNNGRKERIPMLSSIVQKFIDKNQLYKCNKDRVFALDTEGTESLSDIFRKNPDLDKKGLMGALLNSEVKIEHKNKWIKTWTCFCGNAIVKPHLGEKTRTECTKTLFCNSCDKFMPHDIYIGPILTPKFM